jgi:hypothetical protein
MVSPPRWATPRTPERPTFGPVIAAISETMGRPPMPWQRYVWDVALEVQSEAAGDPSPGEWAYDDAMVTVERQAGKTTGIRPVIVHRCGSIRQARAFMTAQKRDKARARWMDATDDLLSSPLGLDVKRKVSIGHEELRWLRNHSTFQPFAPNEDDMHGETPDLVVVDELWAFDHDRAKALIAAYRPGFTTKDAQVWKLSTAGTPESWWLNSGRRAGRKAVDEGRRRGTFYYEHSLPDEVGGIPLEDLTDAQLVQACIDNHPALGWTLRPASLWSAFAEMDGDRNEFLRAYGNRTAEDSSKLWQAIAETVWLGAASPARIPADARVSLGVEVDPDRREASVSAGFRVHGRMTAEVLRSEPGPDGSRRTWSACGSGRSRPSWVWWTPGPLGISPMSSSVPAWPCSGCRSPTTPPRAKGTWTNSALRRGPTTETRTSPRPPRQRRGAPWAETVPLTPGGNR